ncbi:signal recognition particle subunit srp68 [Coemansia erecta]|uniref:Signal recognition particle subunit SRP68 n=1 Tax=Coemansia erecta TaxID=147472 RepID=A0A9W7XXY5_9FUNG|nr:signal recognition particle subunit srp68 [Coemansia erecta]
MTLEFDVFGYVHAARQAHGLRAEEYGRYRRYCAHHLRTVRKAAGLAQRAGAAYARREVTAANASSAEHVEVLVLEAERAWAGAMDVREQHSRTEDPRQHYHVLRRLRAAAAAAGRLADVAQRVCDARTAVASSAYWLHVRAQQHFEAREWPAALDCAVLARVASTRLGATGGAHEQALAQAMVEAADPLVRLAAYQARVAGAQQLAAGDIAAQWHAKRAAGEGAIADYARIAQAVAALGTSTAGAADSSAAAHRLAWRGGAVAHGSSRLAALAGDAETQLRGAMAGPADADADANANAAALDAAAGAFRRVRRAARACHDDAAAAAARVGAAGTDRLPAAYRAAELYATCAVQALAASRQRQQADAAAGLGAEWRAVERSLGAPWFAAGGAAARGLGALDGGARAVVLYDAARQSLARLAAAVGAAQAEPGVDALVPRLGAEIAAADAWYAAVRDFLAAALHVQPRHRRYGDALALLAALQADALPRLRETASDGGCADASAVDALWARATRVAPADVERLARGVAAAIPAVQALAQAQARARPACAWACAPAVPPAVVANALAGAGRPARVPLLVDLAQPAFAAVPAKPLFYDLAAGAVGFDMAAIDAQAGVTGSSGSGSGKAGGGLGSLIGGLWRR